jgi:protein-tyrosine phosphatase
VIDMHCHVLPGIDDGPETIEGSLALARGAAERGISTIVATPHVSRRYGNDAAGISALVEQTNAAIAAEGIALRVLPGAEIAMTRAPDLGLEQLQALTLGGAGSWLLLEPPFTAQVAGLDALISELEDAGFRILLAHPERCPGLQRDPQMLESLVRGGGVLTSITAGSLVGRFGGTVRRFALELVQAELVHNVASDAHDCDGRPPGVAEELEQAGLAELREWLTEGVPQAILDSEDSLPPRPMVRLPWGGSGRASWWRRGRLRRAW